MFRESFHGLTGDVIVHGRSLTGFPYYEEIIGKVKQLPEVQAAVPTLRTYGLININNSIRDAVQDGSRRTVWIGAIYTTLQRMADKGLVTSEIAESRTSGERKRKVFGLSAEGRAAIGQAYDTWARMTRGLKPKLESM